MKPEYTSKRQSDTNKLVLFKNGKAVKTPQKRPLAHSSLGLHRALVTELSKTNRLVPTTLSLYSMLSTQIDFLEKGVDPLARNMKSALLSDVALRTCAGPEEVHQLGCMDFLLAYLKKNKLQHPRFMQTISGEELKRTMKKGSEEQKNFNRLAEVVAKDYCALPIEKRCAVLNATSIHQTTILGLMLVLGHCTPAQYARALNAANCIGEGVWGDTEDEEEAFEGALADAKLLQKYAGYARAEELAL